MAQVGLTADDFPGIGRIEVAEVERVARARGGAPSAELDDTEPLEQSASKVIEATRLAEVYRSVVPSLVTVSVSSESVRRKLKAIAADFGPVSLLEFTIHEVAQLLAGFAELNGFFADGRAWRHRQVAIGFAVNAGRSLKVPVIRNAAALSQLEVCRALRDLSLRYFRDELVMQDLAGGSFTVTDLSDHGVTHFIPVLNDRQSAILGLCAERPGTQHFDLVLAFDHRIADGMRAAEFLRDLRARLEA
jgi:pyruvate/2-oxoglutarate dehydrogenase complex dihydrolipoamide acyltransferase (E2) component